MTTSRPPLPIRHENARIKELLAKASVLPPVKYQILNCQGQDILVGRLKVDTPTPSGHAFILRRFDTGAVSLTTMFRAAYPNAPDDAEKREVQWVKDTYDLTGNNGSSKDTSITRLAGTWVNPTDALELGTAYSLGELIQLVVQAKPDPAANYRRSGNKAAKETPTSPPSSQATLRPLPTPPSPSSASPNPAKRRKESTPAPTSASATSPPPRRSTRTKSPKPAPAPMPSLTSVIVKSPKKVSRREEVVTSGGSDETAVEEEGDVVEESVGTGLREQDLAEQRDMIEGLKAQRAQALAAKQKTGESPAKLKRAREDEDKQLHFEFKEPEIGERVIATNSRISPQQKSAVWGTLAFAFGVAAVSAASYLPNLF